MALAIRLPIFTTLAVCCAFLLLGALDIKSAYCAKLVDSTCSSGTIFTLLRPLIVTVEQATMPTVHISAAIVILYLFIRIKSVASYITSKVSIFCEYKNSYLEVWPFKIEYMHIFAG